MKINKEIAASKKGYIVSEEGTLYNPKGNLVGTIFLSYEEFSFKYKGVIRKVKTHRLQAYQKYGDKIFEEGVVVRHKNGNSLDNSWDNILIGTQSDNMMDIPKQVRLKKALKATSYVRKYNKEEVKEFHIKNKSYKKTMEKFNISSKGTLNYILNN